MAEHSHIEWTDHTFNPWWGCVKVSTGCLHCYAETIAGRHDSETMRWGPHASRKMMRESTWKKPSQWNRKAELTQTRTRVFCASMADVFEDHADLIAPRERLWSVVMETPWLDWMLLTKRPEHVLSMIPPAWKTDFPDHVWVMTSVENQAAAVTRIPLLLTVPAPVRALSVEPLLGPVDLGPWMGHLDWVIVGGESGPHARPLNPQWVRGLRDQCLAAGVPFFFKQWGAYAYPNGSDQSGAIKVGKRRAGRILDLQTWDQVPRR